jgi:hypothetical protein
LTTNGRQDNKNRSGVYVSEPIYLDIKKLENEFYRADIEIHGVDHSGPSYEGRIFLNNVNIDDAFYKVDTSDQVVSKKFESPASEKEIILLYCGS